MGWIVDYLWLIPMLPLVAAGVLALTPRSGRSLASALAIGAMGASFLLALTAFGRTLGAAGHGGAAPEFRNFSWMQLGESSVRLGWLLDPLTAAMLVMVTFVGLLIFIYSAGYMAGDGNFVRFFCFLSLFAAAMLGLLIANSLLLLFMCWELVGLASFLLIGFWYEKPSAAAAAKKAFITTRIGDIGFLLGLVWLYSETGTLLFYETGNSGCLEDGALGGMVARTTALGLTAATGISLLLFVGAMGKSGQVPLHVWLPDAMEGPTPVSALIHAATMVAAGVFLLARVYPLLDSDPGGAAGLSPALTCITWVGAATALFAALVAVAQTDIKRILAYSTVSQLGFMMVGLGTAGVAVGMFHLITHAFFKALLFLGAGSVIHGCHEEQDIRAMGGLRRWMPLTFATYAVGMMALAGLPIFFSGFWSKDEILHGAHGWPVSEGPYYVLLAATFLTAFYMTRQVAFVFFGSYRGGAGVGHGGEGARGMPHESPPMMTGPLVVLAFFALVLGFVGTPAWPWFHGYVTGHNAEFAIGKLAEPGVLWVMGLSVAIVGAGLFLGWRMYGRGKMEDRHVQDPLERLQPDLYAVLRGKFFVDELYEGSVIQLNRWWGKVCDGLDRYVWGGAVGLVSVMAVGLAWINRLLDEYVVNKGFDFGCGRVRAGGSAFSKVQTGQVHHYLRILSIGLAVFALVLAWGWRQ